METYIHNLKLKGEDAFSQQFNSCSEYFKKAFDEALTKEERDANWEIFIQKRIALEMGIY